MLDRTPSPNYKPKSQSPSPYRTWIPAAVLALGAVSILVLIGSNWIRERVMLQDIALGKAVDKIRVEITTTHLWLEEYVTGDPHLDPAIINASHERADALIEAMLKGGTVGAGYVLRPTSDNDLRVQLEELRELFEKFSQIKELRQRGVASNPENVGIGSSIDQQYDDHFHILLDKLNLLETVVEAQLSAARSRARLLFQSLLVCWSFIVVLAVTGLWSRERQRLKAEAALRDSQEQLFQAQKMEAVGQLAGGIAHDINNYLASISAQCELVLMKPDAHERTPKRMATVIATATKASALIRQLLTFSRRQPVQPQILDMKRVVVDLQPMLNRLLGEDLLLQTDIAAGLWTVLIDRSQLEQVLLNLTVNAREAMLQGGRVVVKAVNRNLDERAGWTGEFVALSVTDTGVGIPLNIRERLFEPFFTTKNKATSSGLGLATVYSIVEQSGGYVDIESEVGKGTTFTVYFPRAQGVEPEKEKLHKKGKTPHRQRHVLLVEDNEELRDATRDTLEGLGFSVTVRASGNEALATLANEQRGIEILVTDVVMPGMSGKELADRVLEIRPGLPVLFISGYPDDVVLRHGISEGAVHFLQKPYSIDELAHKIEEVIRLQQASIGTHR